MRQKNMLRLSAVCLLLLRLNSTSAFAQPMPLSLIVTDPTGVSISGATISVIGLLSNIATDRDGKSAVSLEPGSHDISISSPGFITQSRHIDITKATVAKVILGVGGTCSPCLVIEDPSAKIQTSPVSIAALVQAQTPSTMVQTSNGSSPATLQLILSGQHRQNINAADLKALPQKTVTFHNVHTNTDETYSGVPLTNLLAKYGAPTGDKLRGKGLSEYIVATGSDGYKAVLALAETDPSFHPGDVLIADTMNGQQIGNKDGPFRLVVTEDKRPARSVHNLVSIELRTAE